MAVEARHLNLFPPPRDRDSGVEVNENAFASPIGYRVAPRATETAVPMYGGSAIAGGGNFAAAMKCDSGLTYAPVSRKRSREAINSVLSSFPGAAVNNNGNNRSGSFTFLGEDISFQVQQQQLEIDRFVSQHTEKVRMEIEERRKRYGRRIADLVEENVMKKLKAREEEILKIGKMNYALEERVKSLCVENQIWRDLAQSNEARANALRSNLEQVLAQVHHDERRREDLVDDGNSCCGSNPVKEEERRTLAVSTADGNRVCRSCGKEESCVLVLPCRHLCLCTVCGPTRHTCPVCNATKTATLHLNLSG